MIRQNSDYTPRTHTQEPSNIVCKTDCNHADWLHEQVFSAASSDKLQLLKNVNLNWSLCWNSQRIRFPWKKSSACWCHRESREARMHNISLSQWRKEKKRKKEIECVGVDGGTDVGPFHDEMKFLWTERHVVKPTKITVVTTRCSGDSYLNRVELQNGCLSKGHNNTFILSTLRGSPFSENGGKIKGYYVCRCWSVYRGRVDSTPSMKTKINLSRGVEDHVFLKRRQQLLVFLKGSKKEKQFLRQKNPTLYN